jgi:hypothetical protein
MNASQMLHQMCHEVLSNADVKAICKNRGFSAKEAASRALFENFFLSDIGLEAAMASLAKEEVVLLHFLKFIGEEVDVAVFARIYGSDRAQGRYYHRTFTQRYQQVFKQTRLSLVRKGVLLLAEDKQAWNADTKMERWRFRFPEEFERFLPPLVIQTTALKTRGDVRSDVRRRKLMETVGQGLPSPTSGDKRYHLRLVDGALRMGDRPFRAKHLWEWQRACWQGSISVPKKKWQDGETRTVPPMEAATHVFGQLGEKEWIRPDQLPLPLRIFCDAHLDGVQICQAGWKWGCLARQEVDGVTYYRLPEKKAEAAIEPERYLLATAGQPLVVNLETVPYTNLEHLARISSLEVMDSVQGLLTAVPNLIQMGKALPSVRGHWLAQWLQEQVPTFRQTLKMVEQRWGKQIVHEDLLIARIGDLGLRVQLEKAFPDPKEVVFLPNDYIAFPRALWTAIQKVVTKSGHVIKRVQAND